jgi:hypothetical protein
MVKVHFNEGVAIHIGSEPCAAVREDVGEASVGESTGRPLSRVRNLISGADGVWSPEGNTDEHAIASAHPTRRGRRHRHVRKFLSREPGDLTIGQGSACCLGPYRESESISR